MNLFLLAFLSVVVAMAWRGGDSPVGLVIVLGLAAAFAYVITQAVRRKLVPTVTVLIVFTAAYSPGVWEAIDRGIEVPVPVSSTSVILALGQLAGFLAIALAVANGSRQLLASSARVLDESLSTGEAWTGTASLGVLAAAAAVAAFRSGAWSFYGGAWETTDGGIRLQLLYYPLLFGFGCAVGHAALLEMFAPAFQPRRAALWLAAWLPLLSLLFVLQSRRMMMGAVVFATLGALIQTKTLPRARGLAALGGLSVIAGLMVVGSTLWRQDERAASAIDQLAIITTRSVDLGATTEGISERLTYLWFDAMTIEYYGDLGERFSLWDAFYGTVAKAIPGILWPEKYGVPHIVCEVPYESFGMFPDLPCTAPGEGLLFGGLVGITLTAVAFGIVLGLAEALYQRRTIAAHVLATVTIADSLIIECSAFPIVGVVRVLAMVGIACGIIAWVLRMTQRDVARSPQAR